MPSRAQHGCGHTKHSCILCYASIACLGSNTAVWRHSSAKPAHHKQSAAACRTDHTCSARLPETHTAKYRSRQRRTHSATMASSISASSATPAQNSRKQRHAVSIRRVSSSQASTPTLRAARYAAMAYVLVPRNVTASITCSANQPPAGLSGNCIVFGKKRVFNNSTISPGIEHLHLHIYASRFTCTCGILW